MTIIQRAYFNMAVTTYTIVFVPKVPWVRCTLSCLSNVYKEQTVLTRIRIDTCYVIYIFTVNGPVDLVATVNELVTFQGFIYICRCIILFLKKCLKYIEYCLYIKFLVIVVLLLVYIVQIFVQFVLCYVLHVCVYCVACLVCTTCVCVCYY